MSKRQLPPSSRIPKNVVGPRFEIEEINIASWGPLPDGKPPQTQVHLLITVKDFPAPLVMRFKSKEGLDLFIEALKRHRYDVWPGG